MEELCFQFRHKAHGLLIFAQYSRSTIRLCLFRAICFDLPLSVPIWCFFPEKWSWQSVIVAKAINYCSCKSVLPGGVSVGSYQAAALPPPLPPAQVSCTAMGWSQLRWRQLWLLQNDKWETASCSWGFMRDFVSENSYWWCVNGWKLHLGIAVSGSCERGWVLLSRLAWAWLKDGFYLWMNWGKGWRVHLTNWHNTKLGRNRIQNQHPAAKASNFSGTVNSAVGQGEV